MERAAERLWREMSDAVSPFPKGVINVREPIRGTAFFPGGLGLWLEENGARVQFPTKPIMVVGQDFNSERAYEDALQKGTEVGTSPTWRTLQDILRASNISPELCFFTNVYGGNKDPNPESSPEHGIRSL